MNIIRPRSADDGGPGAFLYSSEGDVQAFFINAFRLGARMILDVVGDYKGQFHEIGDVG